MTGSEEVPVSQRMILNSNQGVTNIIEREVIRRDMAQVTNGIFDRLKKHYGPYSSFAALDHNQPLEDAVFTKDGANIVRAMEFASPLEDWVRRAILYIGTNIEKAAGDGTTSSMMFACGMLKHMNATIESLLPISYNTFTSAWNALLFDIKEKIRILYTTSAKDITGKYDPKKVHDMAWMQAYTSSHGNEELADAVARMFECTPSGLWPQMTFMRRRYEHSKLFEVQESKHQYDTRADILSKTVYNMDAGRYLEYKNATLIIINGSIEISNIHWKTIEEEIKNSKPESPLAIICNSDFDNATFGKLMEYTSKKSETCFAVFGVRPEHPRINDFTNLQAITGNDVRLFSEGEFANKPCIVKGVYVKYEFEKLELDNLYTDTREKVDQIRERPYYNDPAYPYYREFADTIQKFIDAYESGDLGLQQQKELKSFRNMYNKLVYDKSINLIIGGNTFDNLAMYDVVDDVIRATIRSLENGMVISNSKTLYNATSDCITHYKAQKSMHADFSKKEELQLWFARCICATLDEFSDVVMDQLYPHGRRDLEGFEQEKFFPRVWDGLMDMIRGYDPTDPFNLGFASEYRTPHVPAYFSSEERQSFRAWWFDNSVNMLNYDNRVMWDRQADCVRTSFRDYRRHNYQPKSMIVQPANTDIVMLERFGEIALKFILTERVIVSGAAYLNKKGTKK